MDKYFMGNQIEPWKGGIAQTITLVITQDCNLRCKYCYMTDKNKDNVMSFATGESAIDYFLTHDELYIAEAVILEFIGGEPFLEIELVDHLTDYFKLRAYQLNHKWFVMYRISISTNGILYSNDKVQKYIKKNMNKLSIGISIDGTKEKNDLQRIYPDGSGTYDDIVKNIELWKRQFPGASTKVTIGHDDLPYIKESIIHLWNLGLNEIPANVVFEDVWEAGDDEIFYNQLKELADYIIENDMWIDYNTSLFSQSIGAPLNEEELSRNSCGTGAMIAVDAEGNFYPCVRFMDYSLNKQKGYVTGNIHEGINRDRIRPFYILSTKNQSDNECLNCDIASGCQWCTGYNYDQSDGGSLFQRDKSICRMHKARVKSNHYLWARLTREKGVALIRNRASAKYLFIMLADNSISFCNYEPSKEKGMILSENNLKIAAEYCTEHFITPVILHSDDKLLSINANEAFKYNKYVNIYPYNNITAYNEQDIIYHDSKSIYHEENDRICCVLRINQEEINDLSSHVSKALERFKRVNLSMLYNPQTLNTDLYYEQLYKIVEVLIQYYKQDIPKQFNVITDDLISSNKTNCNFGYKNFVLAPDNQIYVCPASYYDNVNDNLSNLAGLEKEEIKISEVFNIDNNAVCSQCDIKHCSWCSYWSKKTTGENNIPSSKQCMISQIERKATAYLYNLLKDNGLHNYYLNIVKQVDFDDPILNHQSYSIPLMNFSYDAK